MLISNVERTLDEVRRQLNEEKTLNVNIHTEASTKQAGWDMERIHLQAQIRKVHFRCHIAYCNVSKMCIDRNGA